MKTGLITFYRPERMESVLRTIAIEKKAETLGGDCEVISYHPGEQPAQPARKQRGKSASGDSQAGPHVSGHCFSSLAELQSAELPYDLLLVSGPVWAAEKQDPVFFGAFSRRRKIAYAPSFGGSSPEETAELGQYLADFSHLSAAGYRDKVIMERAVHRTVPVVLDPILLLTAEEWTNTLGGYPENTPGGYLLWDCAGRPGPLAPYVQKLAEKTGLPVVRLHSGKGKGRSAEAPGPAEYVDLVQNAAWVCTDSFAGAALSVVFRKPFFAAASTAELLAPENSPLFGLLAPLGLERRIVGKGDVDGLDDSIDWEAVSARLTAQREASLNFLCTALTGEGGNPETIVPQEVETGLPRLAPGHRCTGCGACASGCPKDAITMTRGKDGFSYPVIDAGKCVHCGHCTAICPLLHQREPKPLPAAFAAWNRDDQIRKDSTSGGVFTALAEYVLEGGGVVFGAAMDGKQHLRHVACFRKEDLWRLRGAKYVQSDLGDTFREIKQLLKIRPVLFSGTPCQVDGLYRYLGCRPENLTTCDLVCHGVPSPGVWEDMARSIEKRKGKGLQAVRFRNKVTGWKDSHFTTVYDDGTVDTAPLFSTEYGRAFGRALFLRSSCHGCAYTNLNRPGDFTLGDFWGLKDDELPEQQKKGVNLLLVNTAHGSHIFDKLPLSRQVFPVERAVAGNPRLASPIQAALDRADFFSAYALEPFDQVRKAFCGLPPLPVRIAGKLLSPEVKEKIRKKLR